MVVGWGVFSSACCFPEVEWVDALSFKVGAFLKELISVPRTLLRKKNLIPPHNIPAVRLLYNIQKAAVSMKSHGGNQWEGGVKKKNSCSG